jgi:hypothetical protein
MREKSKRVKRIGEILIDQGVATENQIAEALRPGKGKTYYSKIGEVLVHLGYATPEQIQAALAEQNKGRRS